MTARSPLSSKLYRIRKNLRLRRQDNSIDSQLIKFLSRCNMSRIETISIQLGTERQNVIDKLRRENFSESSLEKLTPRESSLYDTSKLFHMCIREYNKDIRQYSFVFAVLNVLEDAIRCAVNEHYFKIYGTVDWHKDISIWPEWFYDSESNNQNRLAYLIGLNDAAKFLQELNFGALLAFIVDGKSWSDSVTNSIFNNRISPIDGQSLPNLTQDEVDEKLSIIQFRRNLIFHHKTLRKEYRRPNRNGKREDKIYRDGTPKNTVDRVAEILLYLNIVLEEVMSGIGGGKYSFYSSDPIDKE